MKDDIVEDAITISDCDKMSPDDFEVFMKKVYEKMGYENVERTPHSGDHGADLVMEKSGGEKTVVQTKRWKARITNDSVQEILGAMAWYDAHNGKVVGTSGFTKSAYQEAKKSGIELIDRYMLVKLLEDHPTSLQKSQSISDIRAEDIYSKYPDFGGIIKKMVLKVLKYRDGDYRVSASFLIQEIKSKLVLELIPANAERMCLAKILELLKDRYSIDLYEEEKKRAVSKSRMEKLRQDALAKQREMKRMRDEKNTHDRAEEISIPNVEPITMPPEKAKSVIGVLTELKYLETEIGYGGFKGPVAADLLLENLMRKKIPVAELAGILKFLIRNDQIYESKPGHYNLT